MHQVNPPTTPLWTFFEATLILERLVELISPSNFQLTPPTAQWWAF